MTLMIVERVNSGDIDDYSHALFEYSKITNFDISVYTR